MTPRYLLSFIFGVLLVIPSVFPARAELADVHHHECRPGKVMRLSDTLPAGIDRFRWHVRFLHDETVEHDDTVALKWRCGEEELTFEMIMSSALRYETDIAPEVRWEASLAHGDRHIIVGSGQYTTKLKSDRGQSVRISGHRGKYLIEAGDDSDRVGCAVEFPLPENTSGVITIDFSRPLDVVRHQLVYDTFDNLGKIEITDKEVFADSVKQHMGRATELSPCGLWRYQDRDTDDMAGRLGGSYRLAVIDRGDYYDAVYLGGADTNIRYWCQGRVKARLYPTIVPGQFDIKWIDAWGHMVGGEAYGVLEQGGAILRVCFPERCLTIRLRRD